MSDEAQDEVEIEVVEEATKEESVETGDEGKSEPDIKELLQQAKNPPAEETEEKAEETVEEKKEFDPKTDRVDFDTPEQQAKFNDVYKQMKNSDARNAMLTDMLQDVTSRLDEMDGKTKTEEKAQTEKLLAAKIMEANEDGDAEGLTKAIKDMVDFSSGAAADKKMTEMVNKIDEGKQKDADVVLDLMKRVSDENQSLYPWMQGDHPQHNDFISKASVVGMELMAANPNDPNIVSKVMERVNADMMNWEAPKVEAKPQNRAIDPMQGSNLTQQQSRNKIKMSPAEMEIARKLGVDPKKYAAHRG